MCKLISVSLCDLVSLIFTENQGKHDSCCIKQKIEFMRPWNGSRSSVEWRFAGQNVWFGPKEMKFVIQ